MTQLSNDSLLGKAHQKSSNILSVNKGKIPGLNSRFFYGSGGSRPRSHIPYVLCTRVARNGSSVASEVEEQGWSKMRFSRNSPVGGKLKRLDMQIHSNKSQSVPPQEVQRESLRTSLSSPPRKQRRVSLAQITSTPQDCRAKRTLTYPQQPDTEMFTPPEDESNKENWDRGSNLDINKLLESLDDLKEETPAQEEQEEEEAKEEETEDKEARAKTQLSTTLLPQDIGFPNPSGSNRCWMNATLQMLLGMGVFMQQLELSCWRDERTNQSNLLRTFFDVVRQRRHGRRLSLQTALRRLAHSLGVLDPGFVSDRQQDATEFLVRLLDLFREQYISSERCTLRELQLDNLPSSGSGAQRTEGDNPVCENVEFRLKETYCCDGCGETSSKIQDHLALFVDVPPTSEFRPSLQAALNRYMEPDVRELKCTRCNGQRTRVHTAFSKLPRYLLVQVKRYGVQMAIAEKLTDMLRVSVNLSVKNFVTEDVSQPVPWRPVRQCEEDLMQLAAEEEEDRELQEAMRQSLHDEDDDDRELERAIQLSLQETRISSLQDADISVGGGDLSMEVEDEAHVDLSYRLVSVMMHQGLSPNCGHYVADVYNIEQAQWYHYDDDNVTHPSEQEILGKTRQRNGYVFCYMHRPLFNELTQRHTSAPHTPW